MAQCPRCKEDMPLLSKICPVCGYVEEGGEDGMSVSQLVSKLEGTLREIKAQPEPSLGQGMGRLAFVIWPLVALFMLAMALVSEAGLFWILFIIFLIVALVAIIKKGKGSSKTAKADKQFMLLKHDFEHTERLARHSFGKSREVTSLIDEIGDQIKKIEKRRRASVGQSVMVWLIVLALICGGAVYGVYAMNKALNSETGVAERLERRIDEYVSSPVSPDDKAGDRLEIIKTALDEGNSAMAEDFFMQHCMGQMQDYECAVMIVNHYKQADDAQAAQAFIERCNAMRYSSDKKKLQNLLQ